MPAFSRSSSPRGKPDLPVSSSSCWPAIPRPGQHMESPPDDVADGEYPSPLVSFRRKAARRSRRSSTRLFAEYARCAHGRSAPVVGPADPIRALRYQCMLNFRAVRAILATGLWKMLAPAASYTPYCGPFFTPSNQTGENTSNESRLNRGFNVMKKLQTIMAGGSNRADLVVICICGPVGVSRTYATQVDPSDLELQQASEAASAKRAPVTRTTWPLARELPNRFADRPHAERTAGRSGRSTMRWQPVRVW